MLTELLEILKDPHSRKFFWKGVQDGLVIGCLIMLPAFIIVCLRVFE